MVGSPKWRKVRRCWARQADAVVPLERGGKTDATVGYGPRGEPSFPRNGVWRVDLDAHPKLGALVGSLLELHFFFFASAPIFRYGGSSKGPAGVGIDSLFSFDIFGLVNLKVHHGTSN